MSLDHNQNDMSGSNGSHAQNPERIFNENDFLIELGQFNCPFWALAMCVKAGHLKTRYEFARIIHEGILGL